MKNIATIINWVKANKKKAAIILGVVLFGLLVIIFGEKEEAARKEEKRRKKGQSCQTKKMERTQHIQNGRKCRASGGASRWDPRHAAVL